MTMPAGRIEVPKRDVAAGAWLLVAAVVLFAPGLVLGRVPAFRDAIGFTLPSRFLWQQAVSQGSLPEWNPFVSLGFPVMASPVFGTLYPPHVLLLAGSFSAVVTLLWIGHALWAGAGGYGLARALGCRAEAAALHALFWMASGYALSMWGNGEKVLTGAWIPWLALALLQCMRKGPVGWAGVAGGASLAMIALAGDPFLWLDAGLFALAIMAGEGLRAGWRKDLVRVAGSTGVVGFVGGLLSAPALIPAMLLRESTSRRAGLDRAVAEQWSLHPARLLELVFPGALGDPMDLNRYPGGALADDPSQQALPWAISIYAGVGAWLFAWYAGRNRRTAWLAGIGTAALLIAMGRHTPVHAVARVLVPPLALARYPEKHVLVALAALALLASLGLERVLAGQVRGRTYAIAAAAIVAAAFACTPSFLRGPALFGLIHAVLAGALVLGLAWASTRYARLALLIPAVLAADIVVAGRPLLAWADSGSIEEPSKLAKAVQRPGPVPPRVLRPREHDYLDPRTLPDNAGTYFGIANVDGHESTHWNSIPEVTARLSENAEKAFRLFAVEGLVLPEGKSPGLGMKARQAGWAVFPLPLPPRAWTVDRMIPVHAEAAREVLAGVQFNPVREATVDPQAQVNSAGPSIQQGEMGNCEVTGYSQNRLSLKCDTKRPGLVVVSEAYAPGWEARVDGVAAPVWRANAVMRGVPVGAGAHEIQMVYRTPGLRWGLWLAAAGIGICGVLVYLGRRRTR